MQRDMGKLRALLMSIESGDRPTDIDPEYVAHAIELGLMTGMEMGGGSRKHYPVASLQLTPSGHEFVNLARAQHIWDYVALRIQQRTDTTSYAIWLSLLDAEHKKALNS